MSIAPIAPENPPPAPAIEDPFAGLPALVKSEFETQINDGRPRSLYKERFMGYLECSPHASTLRKVIFVGYFFFQMMLATFSWGFSLLLPYVILKTLDGYLNKTLDVRLQTIEGHLDDLVSDKQKIALDEKNKDPEVRVPISEIKEHYQVSLDQLKALISTLTEKASALEQIQMVDYLRQRIDNKGMISLEKTECEELKKEISALFSEAICTSFLHQYPRLLLRPEGVEEGLKLISQHFAIDAPSEGSVGRIETCVREEDRFISIRHELMEHRHQLKQECDNLRAQQESVDVKWEKNKKALEKALSDIEAMDETIKDLKSQRQAQCNPVIDKIAHDPLTQRSQQNISDLFELNQDHREGLEQLHRLDLAIQEREAKRTELVNSLPSLTAFFTNPKEAFLEEYEKTQIPFNYCRDTALYLNRFFPEEEACEIPAYPEFLCNRVATQEERELIARAESYDSSKSAAQQDEVPENPLGLVEEIAPPLASPVDVPPPTDQIDSESCPSSLIEEGVPPPPPPCPVEVPAPVDQIDSESCPSNLIEEMAPPAQSLPSPLRLIADEIEGQIQKKGNEIAKAARQARLLLAKRGLLMGGIHSPLKRHLPESPTVHKMIRRLKAEQAMERIYEKKSRLLGSPQRNPAIPLKVKKRPSTYE